MEALVLTMAMLAPWAFAAVHPIAILVLEVGLSALLFLWLVLMAVERGVSIQLCPVLCGLMAIAALGVWQLAPLDRSTLSAVAPATELLRKELYPEQLESVIGEAAIEPAPATISLDPDATRSQVAQLIGLAAVFAVVRFGIATPGAFRRFAVACAINGALLSVVGMAQRFGSPGNAVFWLYPTRQGASFGPFICRNNFPDYANICLGLAVGLLLTMPVLRKPPATFNDWIAELAQSPATLWLLLAVALICTGVLFSMSRGGAVGLAAGAICCLALSYRARMVSASFGLAALVALLTLGVVGWFGADALSQRLGAITDREADGGRVQMWMRLAPLAARYPIWGTGLGTFMTVEPQTRQPGDDRKLDWENAHNDYLEALVEGGVVQLALVLLVVAFTFRNGLRAFDRWRGRPEAALALGGLSGFVAVLFHSFADFGMHIPAVALLATVLLAHLASLGNPVDSRTTPRWLALPTAAACLAVALALPIDGWFRERAEHYRLAAIRAANRQPPGERDDALRYLSAAASYTPNHAIIRLSLADAEYEEYVARRSKAAGSTSEERHLVETYLRPALRDYLRLRTANPMFAQSHARLAGNREHLDNPDTVARYLARATRVRPTEEGLWYLAGLDRIQAGDLDRAWDLWRRSLLCSPDYLPSILPVAVDRLGPAQVVDAVVPSAPQLLLKAARTAPLSSDDEARRQFSRAAANRIAEQQLQSKDDLYARGWLLREANRTAEAAAAYQSALLVAPAETDWRLELAELLLASGELAEAEAQVRKILAEQPDREDARKLNADVVRARTRGR
jgi:tetratricopeptide (TPR) repeat protein